LELICESSDFLHQRGDLLDSDDDGVSIDIMARPVNDVMARLRRLIECSESLEW